MKQHFRVIPRDFFNESKLLKCLGQFELIVSHTGPNVVGYSTSHDGEPFDIRQDPNTGNLYVANYTVSIGIEEVRLYTPYNSKENYPLYGEFRGEEYCMLTEKGELMGPDKSVVMK